MFGFTQYTANRLDLKVDERNLRILYFVYMSLYVACFVAFLAVFLTVSYLALFPMALSAKEVYVCNRDYKRAVYMREASILEEQTILRREIINIEVEKFEKWKSGKQSGLLVSA